MKTGVLLFFVLMVCVSCKSKINYNEKVYTDIMKHSVVLFAKEDKGKVYPGSVLNKVVCDTLVMKNILLKSIPLQASESPSKKTMGVVKDTVIYIKE
ncbi:hypothetical protein P3875_11680 [Myroides sp. JBRI-B21084]|uniref:hypothetical protein n=1 Tax=Myroides sp. JBRI-B21084 TaxID=3119977 RepID=UPI0026E4460A|nr:hypothetical protein [Paenimyroides cloacae]WKW46416.1 hypothetical protein P3875_11680 [Paenimyroides cloacae]